jgi:hypothetical protein
LALNPSKSIKILACDISVEGLKKYRNNLLVRGFEILGSENRDEKFEDRKPSILYSAEKSLEVSLIKVEPNDYEILRTIDKCDLSISVGVLPCILGKKNRERFYDFLRAISNVSFITASRDNFLDQLKHFSELRERKRFLENKGRLSDSEIADLSGIKSELKDALEDGELYYRAGWVRNFDKLCPEDSDFLVPLVNFTDQEKLRKEIGNRYKNMDIYMGKTLAGSLWHFVEMYD